MDNTLETLGTIVWYNGWYDDLQKLKKYVQSESKKHINEQYYGICKPKFLEKLDADLFPNTIWSILVLQCGDYGTSPRSGWIEINRAKDAIGIINTLCTQTEEYQKYQ